MSERQTLTETNPELEVGKEYTVELYPANNQIKAKYIGNKKGEIGIGPLHVFAFEENKEKKYVIMDNHWIEEDDGIITYTSLSSAPVRILSKDIPDPKASVKTERSKLLKILKDLGEEI